jgi:hypothetical protein
LKHVISAVALLASFSAFVVFVGGGLFLLVVDASGEKATGAFFAAAGVVAFLATLALVFAKDAVFDGARGTVVAVIAALLALLPVAVLALAALRFAGLPLGTAMPLLDWSVFAAGAMLSLGALSILALGFQRFAGKSTRTAAREGMSRDGDKRPRRRPRSAARSAEQLDGDENVRVTHV